MLFSLLTTLFYTASSMGDKYISAKLQCRAQEFSFLVAAASAVFLSLLLPLTGWSFSFTQETAVALPALILCKLVEFYTSATLLRTASAYELKAWLGLNVLFSYLFGIVRGTETFFAAAAPCAAALAGGIALIISSEGGKKGGRYALLALAYIASKFLYGVQMNALPADTGAVPTLLLVMVGVALLQLPFLSFKTFFLKKGLPAGALTRIPNAAGLWTEALAAQQNILLYSLVQPMQLFILFAAALAAREKLGLFKTVGSVLTLAGTTALTVLIYLNGGGL